jgi:hypothetical protein
LVADEIKLDLANGEPIVLVAGVAAAVANRCPNPRLQLRHAEWLGHVIIGTAVKGRHFAALEVGGREHNDRHPAPLANATTDLKTIKVREAEVEEHGRRLVKCNLEQALLASGGSAHFVPTTCQPYSKRLQQRPVIVHQQHFGHGQHNAISELAGWHIP